MSEADELKRVKSILKLTLGMIELLISEDENALDKAQEKLESALKDLQDEGLQ